MACFKGEGKRIHSSTVQAMYARIQIGGNMKAVLHGPLGSTILETTHFTLPQQPDSTPFIPADFDGPIPGYMPVEQVRRGNRRFILIGLGLLVLIALAVGGYFYFTRSTPEKTLDAFCNAIQGQDYQTAYNQLSNSLQSSETELEFANTLRANGKINTCTHSSANVTNNRATANVTIVTGSRQV